MSSGNGLHSVREIGVCTRSVTGVVPSFGRYESTLERDLMEILRFDSCVESFVAQPITIKFTDQNGEQRSYTPDGLIFFKDSDTSHQLPILCEVKYRADFRKDWKTLIPKFRAAKNYCLQIGWQFVVFTEREIRTVYLDNAKFLFTYKEQVPSEEMKRLVLQVLWDLDEADPDLLLCALCHEPNNRAKMIPVLWNLIAQGAIGCDLNLPLTMRSRIWPEQDC